MAVAWGGLLGRDVGMGEGGGEGDLLGVVAVEGREDGGVVNKDWGCVAGGRDDSVAGVAIAT